LSNYSDKIPKHLFNTNQELTDGNNQAGIAAEDGTAH
jgi:hypothetical protein